MFTFLRERLNVGDKIRFYLRGLPHPPTPSRPLIELAGNRVGRRAPSEY